MKQSPLLRTVVSAEYLMLTVLVGIFFVSVARFEWYWLLLSIPLFELSSVGYLHSPRVGAMLYNVGHSIIGPAILAMLFALTSNETYLFITLLWLFDIFFNRTLGYGLKHTTSFHHTHLGPIGKARKK